MMVRDHEMENKACTSCYTRHIYMHSLILVVLRIGLDVLAECGHRPSLYEKEKMEKVP